MFGILVPDTREAARATRDDFVELVCADEDLLRAEFEEIITAQWPTPPTAPPVSGARAHPAPLRGRPPRWGPSPRLRPRPVAPGVRARTRERSPPPVAGATGTDRDSGPGCQRSRDHCRFDHPHDHGLPAMTVRPADLYAALGVSAGATQGEIDRAFRALLRRHHPDTRGALDEPRRALADAALQQAFAAHAVLGNPERRLAYDEETTAASPPTTTPTTPARAHRPYDRPPIVAGPVRWHPAGGRIHSR